jgi:hypothetical protein
MKSFFLALFVACASAFSPMPAVRPAAARAAVSTRAVAAPTMVEPAGIEAASELLALGIPIAAFTPAKSFISARHAPAVPE